MAFKYREPGWDWEEVKAMAQRLSPILEIAQSLGVTELQFRKAVRFLTKKPADEFLTQYYAQGRYILRQEQFKKAQAGNVTMLKWLGKQELGQREFVEEELNKPGSEGSQEAQTTGYQIFTPGGKQVTVDAMGNLLEAPKQPRAELPIVEAIIVEELAGDATTPTAEAAQAKPALVISGHSEEL